ncbi:hypothetical protein SAMN05216228_101549 [Rhizobium tibeticum]|uniref:Mannosyltransferase OCH1 n=1 Tax=Rhizobium tibeticum TaxID=501024 RepID=A0A1H8NRC2_9HYPH|nr:hypothetical protein [Rhizobium tibeticum]SEI00718.1 hypothetical protein RTCCBAU85039_3659 [Rhizobium tibeticum]SEO32166.1 hypothetical protein SAMN05216228_101549 [Rhizobium tibeticum]
MLEKPSDPRAFGTFWYGGRLDALEQACAHSFIKHGYRLILFSYQPIENAPDGVELRNAADVLPEELTKSFLLDGKPHLAPFSDLFRYKMIRDCDLVWTDLDVLMIKRLPDELPGDIVVREEQGGLNNAVLHIRSKQTLDRLIEQAMAVAGRNLVWGQTGPILLTQVVNELREKIETTSHSVFYPIEHYDLFKILLKGSADECREKCRGAATIHLFNNILSKMGYWKDIAPPAGSFFHEKLEETGGLSFFRDVYPENVMIHMTENYRMRLSGQALGIKAVMRQLIPSIGRTWHHYHPAQNS